MNDWDCRISKVSLLSQCNFDNELKVPGNLNGKNNLYLLFLGNQCIFPTEIAVLICAFGLSLSFFPYI